METPQQIVLAERRTEACRNACPGCFPIIYACCTAGLKLWAVACYSDPMLREWDSCPLGRTWRMVLFVFFGACPLLAEQLQESGTYVAMDKFFASPILFLCLLLQGSSLSESSAKSIVVRATRCGTGRLQTPKKRGDMAFARFGLLGFTQ